MCVEKWGRCMPNQLEQTFKNPRAERNCGVITKHTCSKDGTVLVYRTGCGSSLQFPFPLFSPKTIHNKGPAVTDLCTCDQTFLLLILWVFYKRWLGFLDVCSCAVVQLLCYALGLINDFSLTMRLYRNYSLRRVHLHFDDRLICIAALCTILCDNSLWYQNLPYSKFLRAPWD